VLPCGTELEHEGGSRINWIHLGSHRAIHALMIVQDKPMTNNGAHGAGEVAAGAPATSMAEAYAAARQLFRLAGVKLEHYEAQAVDLRLSV
jgi:hypothetical protein